MVAAARDRIAKHVERAVLDHQLEGAGEQEVAHQHRGLVAEHRIGAGRAAAQQALVHHVVVQQGRGVDELDAGGEADVARTAGRIAAQARGRRASAAAAGACRRRRPDARRGAGSAPPGSPCARRWCGWWRRGRRRRSRSGRRARPRPASRARVRAGSGRRRRPSCSPSGACRAVRGRGRRPGAPQHDRPGTISARRKTGQGEAAAGRQTRQASSEPDQAMQASSQTSSAGHLPSGATVRCSSR